MNDNARKWVEALRSDKYEQGRFMLCNLNNKHCCLGVACRVYQEEVGDLQIISDSEFGGLSFNDEKEHLPEEVKRWLGLQDNAGGYYDGSLLCLNDNWSSFKEIADIIESEPEELFL